MLPKSLILIFLFDGIIQTILVAFIKKTSRAYTGMLSHKNDAFKFCELETQGARASRAPLSKGSWNCFLFPNQAAVGQKHERKSSRRAVLYTLQNIEIWILITFH